MWLVYSRKKKKKQQKRLHRFTPYSTPNRLSNIMYCFASEFRLTNKLVLVMTQREPRMFICRWLQFTSGVECTVSSSSSSESTARVGLILADLTWYDSSVGQNMQKKQGKKALLHPTTHPAVPTYGARTPGGTMIKIMEAIKTTTNEHFR